MYRSHTFNSSTVFTKATLLYKYGCEIVSKFDVRIIFMLYACSDLATNCIHKGLVMSSEMSKKLFSEEFAQYLLHKKLHFLEGY